jgi:hypothetical protein
VPSPRCAPPKTPGTPVHYDNFKYGDTLGVFQYPMFSPSGIDGGYYYVRGTLTF